MRRQRSRAHGDIPREHHPGFAVSDLPGLQDHGLKELVETMGGASTFCKSSGEIPSAISKTFEQILSFYSVTLVVPAHAKRNIQIQIEANGAKILSYRTRFVLK